MGLEFVDSDVEVESRTGMTVREIWERDGEAAFRALERAVLTDALSRDEPLVVAAAGGTVLSPGSRDLMRHLGDVVWLDAPVDVLAGRVSGAGHRPLLDGDAVAMLERMATERSALYDEVSTRRIDVADRTPEEIVDELVRDLS
jgi:shikimate kinase